MTTYNTGNPVPSSAVKDLYDNAQTEDEFVNSAALTTVTRTGKTIRTMSGYEQDFTDFLEASGYEVPVDYVAGLSMTRPTQTVRFSGELYRPKDAALPFTTTTWATDAAKFFAIGDAALRQDLANAADIAKGAALVGYLPPGTGAVARTVYSKLRERRSLFDFMTTAQRNDIISGASVLDHTTPLNTAIASGYEIILPEGTINTDYITLLDGARVLGQGHAAGRGGMNALRGTLIKARPSAEVNFLRMPVGRVRGTMLSGFTLRGDYVNNPTQNGISLDGVVSGADGGLWDFDFNNLFIFNFGGDGFRLVGGYNDVNSPMQFGRVSHVAVERPISTARALVLMGQCEHIAFEECRFDGTSTLGAVGTGSFIGRFDTSHDIRPNNITFMNCSFQRASIGIEVDRCENVVMIAPWFETIVTGVNQKSSSTGLELINPRFANVTTGLAIGSNCRAAVRSPVVVGTIGNLVVGSSHSGVSIDSASKAGVPTSGVNQTISVPSGSTIDAKAHKFVPVTFGAGLTINTIDGYHMPGETITIFVAGNSVTFGAGGNIALGGIGASLVVNPGSTISFIKSDTSGILPWRCTGHA